MKKVLLISFCFTFVLSMNMFAQDKKEHDFIGSKKCKTCHKDQFKKWSDAGHSKAFENLKAEGAAAKAKAAGVKDPLTSEKCLSCHATGAGAKNVAKSFDMTKEGVSCEACHGPGSSYKKMSTMKSREESVAAGMIVPDANTCSGCHQAKDAPHELKKFDFKTEWAKIAHPVDPKKDRRKKKK